MKRPKRPKRPMRHIWKRLFEGHVVCTRRGCGAQKYRGGRLRGKWTAPRSCRPKAVAHSRAVAGEGGPH